MSSKFLLSRVGMMLVMVFGIVMQSKSQTAATYNFLSGSATFATIAGGSGTVNNTTISVDDATLASIPIGFSFTYCGTTYTSLSACSNGWISLNGATSNTWTNSTANIQGAGFLMARFDDLSGSGSTGVYYQTSGTAPNRIFTFQWGNNTLASQRWSTATGSGRGIFQIKLYETSNILRYCYGASTYASGSSTIGIANSTSDYRTITSVAATTSSTAFTTTIATSVAANTLLTWCPPPAISGNSPVCVGSTLAFTNTSQGGTWISSNGAVATVSSAGVLTALAAGTTTIQYSSLCNVSTSVVATVNALPSAVSVSGSGAYCTGNNALLTASGGSGGTIYYQGTTSGGTAITTPSSSQSVSTAGTFYFRAQTSAGCWGTQGSAVVTYNTSPLPIGGNTGMFCQGTTLSLTNASGAGTWASSNTAAATVNSSTGVVMGVGAGTSNITFTLTSTGCTAVTTVSVNGLPAAIGGTLSVCPLLTTTLTNASGAGTWSSSNATIADIGTSSGVVTGVAAGTATITFVLNATGCSRTAIVTVNPSPAPITGTLNACITATSLLGNATPSGVWSSGAPAIASVDGAGLVTAGSSAGTATISYSVAGCPAVAVFVVNGSPDPSILGTTVFCTGTTTTLTNAGGVGNWTSSNTSVAIAGATTGIITGASPGTSTINYSNGCGTPASIVVTVNQTPTSITGAAVACLGSNATYSNGVPGGIWSSTNTGVGTIGSSSGIFTPLAVGTTNIGYTLSNGCVNAVLTVSVQTVPASITGAGSVCAGSSITLANTAAGGTWSSTNTSVATANSTSGLIGGISQGTTTISYVNGCGTATKDISVNAVPAAITGSTLACFSGTTTLSNTSTGGTWASSALGIASVGMTTGVVSGLAVGTATIFYNNGCAPSASIVVTVNSSSGAITGTATLCQGATTTLASTPAGGTWSSSDDGIAQVSAGGVVSGINNGTATITYSSGCGTPSTRVVTVSSYASCATAYCAPASNCTDGDRLDRVVFAGIDNNNLTCANLTLYTTPSASVAQGNSYSISMTTQSSSFTENCAVWIDYNHSGTFDASEFTFVGTGVGGFTGSATVAVPATALPGLTRMRTRVRYSTTLAGTDACTVYSFGETEDYYVNISCNTPAITGATTMCVAGTTTYANTKSGGTWTSGNTAVATVNSSTGVITGISAGTASITYRITNTGCAVFKTITVTEPSAITGTTNVCVGATTALSNPSGAGTWVSGSVSNASVVLGSGVVSGNSAGTAMITFTLTSNGCTRTTPVTVNPLPSSILGSLSVCEAINTSLTNATGSGTWASSNTSVATINTTTGVATGINPGTSTISFTLGTTGCRTTSTLAVNASPDPITGTLSACITVSSSLSSSPIGGTWSSSSPSIATVNSAGVVTAGAAAGTTNISYIVLGCPAIATFAVNGSPGIITGTPTVCEGTTTTLFNAGGAGTWSTGDAGIATVGSTGIVTGVNEGTVSIGYSNGCGTPASTIVTVNNSPSAITGSSLVCALASTVYSNTASGGTWTSSNTSVGTINASSGSFSGLTAGTTTIGYNLGNGCPSATMTVTVNGGPGAISGTAAICAGANTTLTNATGGGVWTSSNTAVATINSSTGFVSGLTQGTTTISYATGCGVAASRVQTVNGVPSAISGTSSACVGAITALTNTATGGTWTSSNTGVATVNSSTGAVGGIATGTTNISYSTGCGAAVGRVQTVNAGPSVLTITPSSSATICAGSVASFSVSTTPVTANTSASSGAISVAVPDGIATGATASLAIAGIPAGATITSMSVTFNMTHGYVGDMIFNLRAPNGNVLNLFNQHGASGVNFANTTISSNGVTAFGSGAAPFTGTFAPTATSGVGATGFASNVAAFSSLYGTPNGTWTLVMNDVFNVDAGTLTSWSITINYSVPQTYTWAPLTGLYNEIGMTTAYTGGNQAQVFASPASSQVYTATATLSSTGCARTNTANVTVNPVPNPITGTLSACITGGSTLSSTTPGGTWSSSVPSVAAIFAGGEVTAGAFAGTTTISYTASGCSTTATFVVNGSPAGIAGATTVCTGANTTLTNPGGVGSWTSTNASVATVGATTGIVTGIGTGTTTINYSNGCGTPASRVMSVNQTPGITGVSAACVGVTSTLTGVTPGGTWSSSAPAVGTIGASSGVFSGLTTGVTTIGYTLGNGCTNATVVQTVNLSPLPVSVTPTSVTFCAGGSNSLTASATAVATSTSASTGSISIAVPDGVATGVTSTLSISGIPAGATITGASVTMNMTHAWIGDMIIGLKAPNNNVLNLFNQHGSSGDNLSGTTVSSAGVSSLALGTPPYIGTFAPSAAIGVGATGNISNVADFASLYSVPNGNWVLVLNDAVSVDPGTLTSWSITISYLLPQTFTWSPTTGLFTNAGLTTAYTGTDLATVYAAPSATTVYTATVTLPASGCTRTNTGTVNVNPLPAVTTVSTSGIYCGSALITASNGSDGTMYYQGTASNGTSTAVATSSQTVTSSGTYYFRALSAAGCWGQQGSVTVTINPVPTSSGATNNGPICEGGSLTLSSNSTAATAWSWAGPSGFTSSLQNPTIAPTASGVYSLNVSSVGTGCAPSTVYTTSVTVRATPVAAPTNNGYICVGGTVSLSANPSGGANTYVWTGSSLTGSTTENPTATPTSTTVYSLTVSDGTTDAGCAPSTVYTTSVTVNSTPVAAPTNSGPICNGGTVNLSANPSGGADTYVWTGSSLTGSTTENPTATPSATAVYSLTVSDGSSQPGCAPSTVYTTSVTVRSTPVAAPTNNGYICVGGTVSLSANPSGGANTYVWTGSSLTGSTTENPTATPTSTTVYSLTVSDGTTDAGCAPSTVYTTSVTVNSTPVAAPTNSGPICIGGTVNLTANPSGGADTYVWTGSSLTGSTTENPTAAPSATAVYSLTVSDGSSQPGCAPSTVYTTSVTVRSTPVAAPTNNGYICVGGTVTLSANPSGGANTYVWTGSSLTGSTTENPTATPTSTTVYSLTVSDGTTDAGCAPSTVYTTSVTVNSTPVAAPTNSSPICNGGTVNLTANPSGGANTYVWTGSSLTGSSTENPTATPSATAVYSLTVSDGSSQPGCAPSTVYTTSVTVRSTPVAAPTNNGYICVGGTVTLSANPSGGANTYVWTGSSITGSTTENPTATPTSTTVYSLTVSDGTTDAGCAPSTVYTTSVTVNSTPVAAPTNSSPICNGGTVNLTANPSGGANTYVWTGSSLTGSTTENPTATPSATSVYSLTVSDGSTQPGCAPSTVYTTSVTVNTTPIASPTNSGPICIGGTVNLTANGSGGASVYSWSGPALSSNTDANPTATPTVTSVYSLTVTNGTTDAGCAPGTVYTTSVTVRSTPVAAPTNNGYICVGGTVSLSANPSGGANTYVWTGSSLTGSTTENPTATPTSTTVYSLTVSDGTTDAGCAPSTVYTTSVTVNSTPVAAPTNSGPICNGGTVNLTANPSGGANTYVWTGSSLTGSTTENPTATPSATAVYSLTVSDGSSQPGCAPSTVYTTSVTVRSTPVAAPTNNGYICVGGTVSLSANPSGGANTYVWTGSSLTGSTTENPTATPTSTTVYSLTVSDGTTDAGCAPSTVYTTSVTVNSTPVAAPTNSGPICNGGTVNLSANPSGGADTYVWTGSSLTGSTTENPTATPSATAVYSLTVSDGSSQPGCAPSTVYTTSVTVRSTPVAAPTNNGYICVGGTVSLSANPSGGANTYVWTGSSLTGSTTENPTATPTSTTVYSLTVSDGTTDAGCAPSTVYTTSVTVNSTPVAAPTNSSPICNGGTVNLTANPSGGANTYVWSGSSLTGSTTENPTATPSATAVYSLTVSDGSSQPGCAPSTVYTTSVTVRSTPVAAPTNNGYICVGGTVSLSANPSGGANTYVWTGSSLTGSTTENPTATPTSTTVYSLTVSDGTTDAGCAPSTVYTTSVTVNSTPVAAPTNSGPICNGGTVNLTANPSGGADTYVWTGSSLTGSTTENPTATPSATSVYSLTVSDGSSQPGCAPSTVYTTSVTVRSTPVAAPTNNGYICVGGTVSLSANPSGGANTYVWTGSSLTGSTTENPTATPTSTTVYSLTVSDGTTDAGCAPSTVYTTSVTVNSTPVAAPTNSSPICNGGTVNLTANPSGGANTYVWTGSSLTGSTTENPTATPSATSVYSLTVSDGSSQPGCAPSTVYTTSVTVRSTPVAAPTNNGYICVGGTVSLSANPSGGANTYVWTGSSLTGSTTENPTATPTSTTVYSLTVSDGTTDAGCAPTTVYTTSVTVNSTPVAAPTNSGPICNGGTVNLSANPSGGADTYVWTGSSLTGSTTENPTATPSATAVYSLTVSDGSSQPGCAPSTVYTTSVTVRSTPVAAPTNNGYICVGGTVSLSANPSGGANTYVWTGSSLTGSTTENPTATPTSTTVYSLTVSDGTTDAGCAPSTVYTTSVTVNSTPVAAPTNSGPICNGGTVNLSANPSGGADTYVWTGSSLTGSTTENPTATPSATAVYSLTVSDGSSQPGCAPSTVYTTSVTVRSTPVAAPTNNGYICVGGTVALSANPSGGANTYVWTGSSLTGSTTENPTATPTSTTVYSLTVSDGTTDAGCAPSTVYTTSVAVNSTPVAAPTNSSPICNGGTVNLTANPSGGANTYVWSGSLLTGSTTENPTATPSATAVYSLTVSDGSSQPGCAPSTVYTTSVTVRSTPVAAPTNNGYICVGGTVSLSANPSGGANTYVWTGSSLTGSNTENPTATPTSTTVYSLTVSDGTTDAGCAPSTVYTTSVTVNSTPVAAPTNSSPICNGGTVNLTANPSGGADTYVWTGSSLTGSTTENPTATPSATSVYSLTVSDGSSQPGCAPSTVYTTSVTVNTTPIAAPANSGPICNGGTVSLTANGSGGASVYSWSGPALSSNTDANPTATPTVTSVYSLTVTNGTTDAGCAPSVVYTTTVTVRSTPVAAPTNNGYICVGGTVSLSANPSGGANTYVWTGSSLTGSTTENPTATPTSTTVYSLTVSDGTTDAGCAPSTVYTTSVTVNSTPVAAPTNSGPICNGGTVNLTANPSGGADTYVWTGSSLTGSTTENPTATPSATAVYSLTVSDGSSQPGCAPSTVYTTSVTVRSTPVAAPTNNGYICVGGTVNLTANPSGGANTYVWTGSSLTGSTTENPTATPTSTTVYSLTVSDGTTDAGCAPSTVYTTSVTVNSTPVAAPTNSGPICIGGVVVLSSNATGGANTFVWSGSALSGSSTANPTAMPTATSVYSLTVSDGSTQSGCAPATVYTTSVTVNTTPIAAPTNSGPICNGGTVSLTANGADGASVYTWSGPALSAANVANPTATPTATSVYSLTVTNGTPDAGCSPATVYTTVVTVRAKPIAAPTNNGYICVGGTVSLTANPAGGANTFMWSGSSLSASNAANPTATPTTTTIYSLMVSDGTTDAGCAPSIVYTTQVTVNSKPIASPTNNSPICNGGTLDLFANPAGGANTFVWSGSSLTGANTQNPTAVPIVSTVYSLTVSDGSTKPGCSPSTVYTTSATVNVAPAAIPTNSGPICNGGTVNLTGNPIGGATIFTWSGPSLSSTTAANPTATPSVTTVYSLSVTNGTGDVGCSPTTVFTTTVTVRPTPVAAPTNNGYICNGGTVALSANPASGATTFAWSGLAISNATSANPTATPNTNAVYSLTVTDGTSDAGCSPSTVYTTSVSVHSTPVANPTNSGMICNGNTVTLNANPAGGASTFLWTGSALSGTTVANPTATPSLTSIYSLTVTDGSTQPGCSPATVYTTSVTVNQVPNASTISGVTTFCRGVSVTLSAAIPAGTWSSSNPAIASINSSGVVSGIAHGTATITYTTICGFATRQVTVSQAPTINSVAQSGPVCEGTPLSFSSTASGSTGPLVYLWTGPVGYASGIANPTISNPTTASAGVYTLNVVDPNGCYGTGVNTVSVTIKPSPAPIGGFNVICLGNSITLTSSPAGGTWSSSNHSVSTVTTAGVASGMMLGTATIGYTSSLGCVRTKVLTVVPTPSAITGVMPVCKGADVPLSNSVAGGVWSSGNETIATVNSATGVVTGIANGITNITYTVGGTCSVSTAITVNVTLGPNEGTPVLCVGQATSIAPLTNSAPGGTWNSGNLGIAVISPTTGLMYGESVGTVFITYRINDDCYSVSLVTVNPAVSVITGPNDVCLGSNITLSASDADGVWTSSDAAKATIGSASGVVSGLAIGSVTMTYTISTGCYRTYPVIVHPVPATILGAATICEGSTSMYTTSLGGAWSTSNSAVMTIGTDGVATGVGPGVVTMTYTFPIGCFNTKTVTVNALPPAISGSLQACTGVATLLTSAAGTWSSSTLSVATINAGAGVLMGMAAGTSNITFTASNSCKRYAVVTVNATPAPITGALAVCDGGTSALASTTTGGTWSSADGSVATIGSTSGIVTSVDPGTTQINYTTDGVCFRTAIVSVNIAPGSITGFAELCATQAQPAATLVSAGPAGSWTSNNTGVVTISPSSGIMRGISVGTATISYVAPGGCSSSVVVTVNPAMAPITGTLNVCPGINVMLSNATSGGTWTSTNLSKATIDASTGVATGVSAGTTSISYSINPSCYKTALLTVHAPQGAITGAATLCQGTSSTLGTTPAGGTWLINNPSIATINASGILAGINVGTTIVSYTNNTTGCYATREVSVVNLSASISGPSTVCKASTMTLTGSPAGGSWTSTNISYVTVDPSSGMVTGVNTGSATVSYSVASGCFATRIVSVTPSPGSITGTFTTCVNNTVTLNVSPAGGTWSVDNPGIASFGPTTGVLTGVATGVANVTYTAPGGCTRTATVSVGAQIPANTGSNLVCVTQSAILLSNTVGGGTWSASNTKVQVVPASGLIKGMAIGTAMVTYTASPGCYAATLVSVNATLPAITGGTAVCQESTVTLSIGATGGVWSSSNTDRAIVGAGSGVVTGVATGGSLISYMVSPGCYRLLTFTTNTKPVISGATSTITGNTVSLTKTPAGGVWSSSNSLIATVSAGGVVGGVASGAATISYLVTSTGCFDTHPMTVMAPKPSDNIVTKEDAMISIFPNPTNGSIVVRASSAGRLMVFAIDGKEVASFKVAEGANAIDLPTGLSEGVYMCRYIGDNGEYLVVKLVYKP